MIRAFLVVALFAISGCSPPVPAREACYNLALATFVEAAAKECPGKFSTCPARPALKAKFAQDEAVCK